MFRIKVKLVSIEIQTTTTTLNKNIKNGKISYCKIKTKYGLSSGLWYIMV